jgi:hypothetical protein
VIRRLLLSAVAVGILVATSASPAAALSSSIDPMWMTNGTLFVQTQVGNIMYLGGKNLTAVRSTPNGTPGPKINVRNLGAINITTGQGVSSFHPMVTHATDLAMVRAIAATPDGSKIYIAGHFDAVDGLPASNIARIDLSTGTIDTSFKAKVAAGGTVNALLVSGNGLRIYLGGAFGTVDGVARKNLAALNAEGSIVDGWDRVPNGKVRALTFASDAATVFVGGTFSTMDNQARTTVARLDASTGALDNWSIPSGTIQMPQTAWSLVAAPTRLYGGFGHKPNFAQAFRLDNGTSGTSVWKFSTVGNVQKVALTPDGLSVIAGGHFGTGQLQQQVCTGQNLRGLMKLNAATGILDCTWIPQLAPFGNNYNGAWDLDFTANHLWVAGGFSSVNTVKAQNVARFSS